MKRCIGMLLGAALGGLLAQDSEAVFWRKRSSDEGTPSEWTSSTQTAEPAGLAAPGAGAPERPPALDAGVTEVGEGDPGVVTRRPHLRIEDDESERGLRVLARARQLREEEIQVLGRLIQEKDGELKQMNEQLREGFGIDSEDNYQFDQETRTLYRIQAKPEVSEDIQSGRIPTAEDLFDRDVHRVFNDESDELAFIRLVSAKKITVSELAMLRLLLREKSLELDKVLGSLRDRFAIAPDKHYEYDAPNRTLLEVVRSPTPANP